MTPFLAPIRNVSTSCSAWPSFNRVRTSNDTRAYLLLILTTLCWGANPVFGRLAVGEVSPMFLVCMRWLGVFVLLVILSNRQLQRDWKTIRQRWLFILAMGGLGFTGFNALFYTAAHSTTAINIGIINSAIPVFILMGVYLVYRSPVTRQQIAGVAVALIGVLWVASSGSWSRLANLTFSTGDVLMIIASVLYAGYSVGLRKRPQVSALCFLTVISGAALLTSLPLLAVEFLMGQLVLPSPKGWLVILLITLFPSFLAQLLYIKGVGLLGPDRAGIFFNLVPVFASIFAVVFLQEPFQFFQAIALGLVLGGIWLSEKGKRT